MPSRRADAQRTATLSSREAAQRVRSAVVAHAEQTAAGADSAGAVVASTPIPDAARTLDDHAHWAGYATDPIARALLLRFVIGAGSDAELRRELKRDPWLLGQLGFNDIPSVTTLWRARTRRFNAELVAALRDAARVVARECRRAGLEAAGPPKPAETTQTDRDGRLADERPVVADADRVTDAARREAFPELSLARAPNAAIDESAFWSLGAFLGLQSDTYANAGARRYLTESDRPTPLGDNFRAQLQKLPIAEQREQLRAAARNLAHEARAEGYLDRKVPVAIDTTTGPRFWGDRSGREETIIGTKRPDNEYAYHYATIQIVTDDAPIVLDARPVKAGEGREEIVEDLLSSATQIVAPTVVLMDREFDTKGVRGVVEGLGLQYLTPGTEVGERGRIERLDSGDVEVFRDREGSLMGPPRREIYKRADTAADDVETTISTDEGPSTSDRTTQADLWDELDDTLDVDVTPADDEQEAWGALDDVLDREESVDDAGETTANYHIWKTNLDLPDDDEAALRKITRLYSKRWRIESGYQALKRFLVPTTSKSHRLRFWYFAFASILYGVWRLVDVILRERHGSADDTPIVPAATVVSFLRRETGVG